MKVFQGAGVGTPATRRVRRVTAVLAALVLALAALLALPAPASAHAGLLGSSPADGSSLEHAPTVLTLRFDEPVSTDEAFVVLRGTNGSEQVAALRPAGSASVLEAALPVLTDDAYRADWQVRSDDGHLARGTVSFGVGTWGAVSDVVAAGPDRVATVVRTLALGGLAVALGALLVLVLVRRRGADDRIAASAWSSRLRVLALAGGAGAVAAVLIGRMTAVRLDLLPTTPHLAEPAGLATALLVVHLAVACAWVGGLVALVVAVLPDVRRPWRRPAVVAVSRGFAWLAVPAVAGLVITGLLLAGLQVATVDALLTTPYGLLLVAKVALLLVAGMLGMRHALGLRRALVRPPSMRSGVAEVVVAGTAVLLAAALGTAAPPHGPAWEPRPPVVAHPATSEADDLVVTIGTSPARVGRSLVTVRVLDTLRPAPGTVTGVDLDVALPGGGRAELAARRGPDGLFTSPLRLEQPGRVEVVAVVHRAGLTDASTSAAWTVVPAPASRGQVVSDARLMPYAITGVVAATLLGLLGLALVARPRRRVETTPDTAPSPTTSLHG